MDDNTKRQTRNTHTCTQFLEIVKEKGGFVPFNQDYIHCAKNSAITAPSKVVIIDPNNHAFNHPG